MGIISNLYVTATHCRRFARITSIFFFIAFLSHVASINAFFSRLQAEYFRHTYQLNKGKKSEKSRLIFLWAVTDRSGTFLLA